jgi:hypothetical protein
MGLQFALEQLATHRTKNTRASQDVFRNGLIVLQKKGLKKLGDDGKSFHYTCYNTRSQVCCDVPAGWTFLEQLTLASIDVGRLDVADVRHVHVRLTFYAQATSTQQCLQLIADKFPNSPRVDCLTGIRMEATEPPEIALKYYADILEADSANAVRACS